MYQDETLTCRDCGKEFVFTASEQAFYAEKGFQNKPRRCPECRAAFRAQNGNARPQREMYTAICADCGKETQVPFQPRGDKPVYCRDCFAKHIRMQNSFQVKLKGVLFCFCKRKIKKTEKTCVVLECSL